MSHIDVRAIHGIPAFFIGLLVGAASLGFLLALSNATGIIGIVTAPLAGLIFSFFSFLYVPAAALFYFPVFFALRRFKSINRIAFAISGAALGFLMTEPWTIDPAMRLSAPFWYPAATLSGAVGGLASFWFLERSKHRDEN